MTTNPSAKTIFCYGDSNTWGQKPDSPFISLFDQELIEANLNHWEPTRDWDNDYPGAWSQAKQAWRRKLTVEATMVLKAFEESRLT